MKTKPPIILAVFLLGGCFTPSAQAHDTWLIPERFNAAPKSSVRLDLTSGMAFPALETGPKKARVQSANCRLAGETFKINAITEGPKSLRFATEVAQPGVATFWVEFPPKEVELKPEQVHEYLEEIGAPPALLEEWAQMKPQRWREAYSKHQKTFVRVGAPPAEDRSWKEPVGGALEIVPAQDPTTAKAGAEFAVHVLKNGKPFPDFPLNAVAAGET
ncbi:MAG: DUF4198 domain-containing protein, partial [Chthoniobacterales bacterium]